ncbi:hypothetical protein FNV43_RR16215 [Rhamnella rubrinervis]|uniref:60S ribosomal protein L18a-like protein n=1 Tax=Rhamnella rubrinervis TaxID=2594499 RepID=A0A8K0GXE3_9ROSA|nr:hypothetical protein FNV43_RR16215 [Rhamnella rubrinervis]
MGEDENKVHHHQSQPDQQLPPPQYGTFQGVANYPPPLPPRPPQQPGVGFPRPVPPPGATDSGPPPPNPQYFAHGYQTVPGYVVAEGRPVREPRLPCCGCGCAWFLFIIGFFLLGVPWYIGAIILLCSRVDHREKPGYVACALAAVLATVAYVIGAVKLSHD